MTGTGIYYETRPRPREELLTPDRPGEHVWLAIACFRVAPETLRGQAADQVHLDRENLSTIEVGCFVCEQPWSERLSYRRCPGEPVAPDPPA
jgi:hypothetical protein